MRIMPAFSPVGSKRLMSLGVILCSLIILSGCTGAPEKVRPVEGFVLESYLGTWYEIARLDHSFERGLDNVSATYALRDDGGVAVINRGYAAKDGRWKEATGKAYFVDDADVGHLKVSFFGPFYSSYIIFGLDQENYSYAFVSGYNTNYLWLLAREKQVDDAVIALFLQEAQSRGFDTDALIFVAQDQ